MENYLILFFFVKFSNANKKIIDFSGKNQIFYKKINHDCCRNNNFAQIIIFNLENLEYTTNGNTDISKWCRLI